MAHPPARPAAPRRTPALAAAAGTLAAVVALHLRDPHERGSWGFCPVNLLTGGYCPGCGGLRAVNDLTHLDVAAALSSNLLVVALMPLAVGLWARWLHASWTGRRRPLPPGLVTTASVVLLALTATFTLVRNLPSGSWLAP